MTWLGLQFNYVARNVETEQTCSATRTVSSSNKDYPPRSLCYYLFTLLLYRKVLNVFSFCGDFKYVSVVVWLRP